MPETATHTRLLIRRDRFDEMQLDAREIDAGAGAGEVLLEIELFALTANNITYAVYGDALGYWRFFPVDKHHGQLPVWGYADVVDSGVDGIRSGQRWFGYFPLATYLRVRPGRVGRAGFRDDAEHRRELPEVYNWYQRTDNDPAHDADIEPLHAIYRPLFVTAFGLADHLKAHDLFGARRVVVSSASSKTAYATAFCLGDLDGVNKIGLTSESNQAFVAATGLYDAALAYDALETLAPSTPTLYIDVAGDRDLKRAVHEHFGDSLVHDAAVGSARALTPMDSDADLPGPRPVFFFAPDWIARRQAEWGSAGFERRIGEATAAFYRFVQRPEAALIRLVEHSGMAAARGVVADLLAGRVDPHDGHIVRLR